jgi:carbamoyl-phosphate synthase large subunit
MKILVEGIGSPVFGPRIKYMKNLNWDIVGIDINNRSFGLYKNITPYIVPKYNEENSFVIIEKIIKKEGIDIIFPTINEGLLSWSRKKEDFKKNYNTDVIISDETAISICIDKWETYLFFKKHNIPTPLTSIEKDHELFKPRNGRGSTGIYLKNELDEKFDMDGYISQELIDGDEYTIDVLCDFDSNPIYIIPRLRLNVESGVSVAGKTIYDKKIIEYTKKIIEKLKPVGPINIQCFKKNDKVKFIEINPRLAGGSSLSFASSDNWFKVISLLLDGKAYREKNIKFNNYMFRYYEDVIVQENELIK